MTITRRATLDQVVRRRVRGQNDYQLGKARFSHRMGAYYRLCDGDKPIKVSSLQPRCYTDPAGSLVFSTADLTCHLILLKGIPP